MTERAALSMWRSTCCCSLSLVVALVPAGVVTPGTWPPHCRTNTTGLVDHGTAVIAPIVLLIVIGLRGQGRLPGRPGRRVHRRHRISSSPCFPFVDMIIALKLLIVVVWVGAGVSKVRQPPLRERGASDGQQQRSLPVRSGSSVRITANYPNDIRPSAFGRP